MRLFKPMGMVIRVFFVLNLNFILKKRNEIVFIALRLTELEMKPSVIERESSF